MKKHDLGFTLVHRQLDGRAVTVARFACTACDSTADITVTSGKPLNPEGYAKSAANKGWSVDPWRKQDALCSFCAANASTSFGAIEGFGMFIGEKIDRLIEVLEERRG